MMTLENSVVDGTTEEQEDTGRFCAWCKVSEQETDIRHSWDDHDGNDVSYFEKKTILDLCRECFYEGHVESVIDDIKKIYADLAKG